jgi:hypothetical protein
MIKKLIACLILATLCLACLTACGKDDGVPDGMYSVTRAGEPFILYVPGDWTDNRDSGISSAYYSVNDGVTVSARAIALAEGTELIAYVDACAADYAESLKGFNLIGASEAALGGQEARRLEYTFERDVNGNAVGVVAVQYYVLHGEGAVLLSFYCATAAYNAEKTEMFEKIRSELVLCEPSAVGGEPVTDKSTPAGMKRASYKGLEYVFYVPENWITDSSDKMSAAYFSQSDRSNVSVTAFAPDSPMTVEQYFNACAELYKRDIRGYELLGSENITVDGKSATSYTYKAAYGESEVYRITQTVIFYNEMFYSITYTALEGVYDSHAADVQAMLDNFNFR